MESNNSRIIFHIDVNSAYLSWSAVYRLQHGESVDLRQIPSVVGGDPTSRHGIVLAKSIVAKKFGIKTGETLYSAKQKCPELLVVPPKYDLYLQCSNSMMQILMEYTPKIQRFSIDECFLDFSGMKNYYEDPVVLAYEIKKRIKEELGFTVNVGISCNKLLAKMAGELKKPDKVHTLFPIEIKEKMWPLPIEELFMVGSRTAPKLHKLNINTIGDLANYDLNILRYKLKSHGELVWKYANGIEGAEVKSSDYIKMKGIGNSTTTSFDVEDKATAHKVILSLCEMVGMRLRNVKSQCSLVAISIKGNDFITYSRQKKMYSSTDCTVEIANIAWNLFDEAWRGHPIRHIGVSVAQLSNNSIRQVSIFDTKNIEKDRALDNVIDNIRQKYGSKSIVRGVFIQSGIKPLNGGVGDDSYPVMSSIL